MRLNEEVPDFTAASTTGEINFHREIESSWAMLFTHPQDFTPICTTELALLASMQEQFIRRDVKIFVLSCCDNDSHMRWLDDISAAKGVRPTYPIIADPTREIANSFKVLDPNYKDESGNNMAYRATFIIGPDKKLRAKLKYSSDTGRDLHEIIRLIEALKVSENFGVETPMDWKHNQKVFINPHFSDEEARRHFPKMHVQSVPSGRNYMRWVDVHSS